MAVSLKNCLSQISPVSSIAISRKIIAVKIVELRAGRQR